MKVLKRTSLSVLILLFLTVGLCFGQDTAKQIWIRGVEYAAQVKFKEAKEEFEKALKVDSSYGSAKRALKVIEDVNNQKLKNDTAITLFKGISYGVKEQWDEAIVEFNKAIEINPTYSYAYSCRGLAYVKGKGQYDKAISDFSRAIEINPSHTIAYFNRGGAFVHIGQSDKAISDYTKAIEINPRDADAYYNRGVAYCKAKGQYDKAISDFSKVIEINPTYADAYYNRGVAYCKAKGQYDKAISDFSKVIEINPKYADAYYDRGVAFFYKRKYEKVWDDIQTAQNLGYQVDPGFLKDLRGASGRDR
jgi:tetratricopeptide (TPR) repeat protein